MDLIIFTHPDNQKSHNAAILRYVQSRLRANGTEFEMIDLYADGFDPVLRLTKEDKKKTDLVQRYQSLVAKANRLIFIHPVWWYNLPTTLKGFVEHVFNSGLAHEFTGSPDLSLRIEHKLAGKTAIVINTYGRSRDDMMAIGNPLPMIFDKAVLQFCGVRVTSRIEWFDVKGPGILKGEIAKEIDKALS